MVYMNLASISSCCIHAGNQLRFATLSCVNGAQLDAVPLCAFPLIAVAELMRANFYFVVLYCKTVRTILCRCGLCRSLVFIQYGADAAGPVISHS